MKIAIDISEEDYRKIQDGRASVAMMRDAIRNGKVLPKGHGRLIDADALNRRNVNCANVPMNFIDVAPTIIEAESEE